MQGPGRRRRLLPALAIYAILIAMCAGCTSADSAPNGNVGYPRSATVYLSQDELPAAADLARYDVVVIDSEWAHRTDRSWFETLRRLDPGVVVLAYVNLVDVPDQLGTAGYYANRYALWQFTDPTTSKFPAAWLARTADGSRITQFPGTIMANLSDEAPRVAGQTYAEYATNWMVERVWSTGLWDGIFLDVWGDRVYGADRTSWDVAGNRTDVPDSQIYGAGGPWERGITAAERLMRQRMPNAVLVANGDRTLRDRLLNGRSWESFADAKADRDAVSDLISYGNARSSGDTREPRISLTINSRRAAAGSEAAYRDARFHLTGTLLQDGYWAPTGQDYEQLAYYDEMDGGGLGRGYLGTPIVADPTVDRMAAPYTDGAGEVAPGVYRRDFTSGIVLNNPSSTSQNVDLGGAFRHLAGKQDPSINDGSVVNTVTVPAKDGLILLKAAG